MTHADYLLSMQLTVQSSCRAVFKGKQLLGDGHLNVATPTELGLANSLPGTWERDSCKCASESGSDLPDMPWLLAFWTLVEDFWHRIPEELCSFALVPVWGGCLASVAHCRNMGALSVKHLAQLPDDAAAILARIGCLCITEKRAGCASPIAKHHEPMTAAIRAISVHTGVPLRRLVSMQKIGSHAFHQTRQLLADHVWGRTDQTATIWETVKVLPLFEDYSGQIKVLPQGKHWGSLPNAAWEAHMPQLEQMLDWSPIPYHSASGTQRSLLQLSQLSYHPQLADFLHHHLLPAINKSEGSASEAMLLQALDDHDLAARPFCKHSLNKVFANGALHNITQMVDSTNGLFRALFTIDSSGTGYALLPEQYTTDARLALLKKHGLAHAESPRPEFFLECVEQFKQRRVSLTTDEQKRLSLLLVGMLFQNIDTYLQSYRYDIPSQRRLQHQLSESPIFQYAELSLPYHTNWSDAFVSLAGSADHAHHRLVGLAVPVTHNVHGSTVRLRAQLGLDTQPQLRDVVEHMLKAAAAGYLKSAPRHERLYQVLTQDVHSAYQLIVEGVKNLLPSGGYVTGLPAGDLQHISMQLSGNPWVLVQDSDFVTPSDLCFENTDYGKCFALVLHELSQRASKSAD